MRPVQSMTEEAVKLKFDLRHTLSALARAEGREDEAINSLRVAEVELREVRDKLQAVQNYLLDARDGLQFAQSKLLMVWDELFTSQSELRGSKEEPRVARDELCNKIALLDGARCKAVEVVSSVERLTEEFHGLRGDLHRQETLVVQRDEVIGRLRDEAYTQWALGGLPFKGRLLMST